jgi:AraC family transcriptional activator FtrA
MHLVSVVVTPNAPIFELSIVHEVFGIQRPDLVDPWYQVRYCAERPGRVDIAGGFSVEAPWSFEILPTADTVIVPACGDLDAEPAAVLSEALQAAHARGARIAAICTGTFILAGAGLLRGRRATTHWRHAAKLASRYPSVDVDGSVLYLEDGGVFTSAGTAAGLDLCLELVRRDYGAAVANKLARRLVVPPHRAGGQAQYIESPLASSGNGLDELLEWILRRVDQPIGLADLAAVAHMSPRTLARQFQKTLGVTPVAWVRRQRLARAQELLETTDEPIERIAELSGFGHTATFRHHFTSQLGISPVAYRRSFRGPGTRYREKSPASRLT